MEGRKTQEVVLCHPDYNNMDYHINNFIENNILIKMRLRL